MNIAIIDDDGSLRRYVSGFLSKFGTVMEYAYLPDDIRTLEGYDALVVDNDGIGNDTYRNGVSFLKEYAGTHRSQKIIHFSGFVTKDNAAELQSLGVIVATKNGRVDEMLGQFFRKDESDGSSEKIQCNDERLV